LKSPITGKEMILKQEQRSIEFRKKSVEISFHFYLCPESGLQFTTTELDEVNLGEVIEECGDQL
jgi:hypothetical protein